MTLSAANVEADALGFRIIRGELYSRTVYGLAVTDTGRIPDRVDRYALTVNGQWCLSAHATIKRALDEAQRLFRALD